ncbi:MAG: hypothetical protein JKY10_07855 [Cohaesibacteraceae bacterium]|nr:hypothetical protein [Cohaesibacteraceae bacterium]
MAVAYDNNQKRRQLTVEDYREIKDAFRRLVSLCLKNNHRGATAAAIVTRVSQERISQYYSHDEKFKCNFPPADIVADLEAHIGEPIVTEALADLQDRRLIKRDECTTPQSPVNALLQVIATMGQVQTHIADTLADGEIDTEERKELKKTFRRAEDQLTSARRAFIDGIED